MKLWRFLLILVFTFPSQSDGYGSCRENNLCCKGRDSSCVAHSDHFIALNTVLTDQKSKVTKPCYCDYACVKVGDCCSDFQQHCGAAHCEVSDWGPWSNCNADCGTGVMTRERRILRPPKNGGDPCPDLLQKRSCSGSNCEGKTHAKAHRETAMILPASYSSTRYVNETNDIRSNLRLRYRKDPAEENSKEYCIVFEVTKVRKACENLGKEITPKLSKGAQICVICETAAMRKHLNYRCQGHGADHKTTRFTFLSSVHCHGRWQRKEVSADCNCYSDKKADFIFV